MKYTREKQLENDIIFKDCTYPQATFYETSKCGVIAEMLGFSGIRMYSDMIPLFKDVLYLYLIMFC